MRYAPASRLSFSDEVAVPQLVADFGEKLALIKEYSTDRAATLKLATARKGLANEHKRSVGQFLYDAQPCLSTHHGAPTPPLTAGP